MNTQFGMHVGDVTLAVTANNMRFPAPLRESYRDYVTDREPDVRIEFSAQPRDAACRWLTLPPDTLKHFDPAGPHDAPSPDHRPRIRPLGERTLIERVDFAGVIDPERQAGRCVCAAGMEYLAIESFLRACFSVAAVRFNGLLLHAAGVVRNGQAHVFAGPSGTGKSTIAGLSAAEGRILSDEMVYVRCGGDPRAFATPFHGTNDQPSSVPAAPLRVVLFPVKDTIVSAVPLAPPEAVRRLLAATFSFEADPQGRRLLLDLAAGLIEHTPALELRFRKDPTFWPVIDARA